MLSTITFLVVLSISFIQVIPITSESCKAQILDSSNPCSSSVIVSRSCDTATLNLGETRFKTCTEVRLFWSYPMNNLTVTVETPFTQQHQPYTINIDNRLIKDYSVGIYRILNGQEIHVKSVDDVIVQNSDSNYQIILKFQAEKTITYYGFPFMYKVTKS
jgi:hypothetical protein